MKSLGQEYIKSQEANYYLARFNKEVIAPIVNPVNIESSRTVSQFSSLKFTVIYTDDNSQLVGNIIAEQLIKEVMFNGEVNWYKINNVGESTTNNSTEVSALSLESELTMRTIEYDLNSETQLVEGDRITIEEYLKFMLYNSRYKIGNISDFSGKHIKFSTSFNNKYEAIENIRTLFSCTIIFDNINETINLYESENYGRTTGITLHHNNVLKDFNVNESRESIVTRLYVRGEDNISISGVNPTGKPYIEDYSPLIYGYERNQEGNVLKGSPFLSDELCDALIAIEKVKDDNVSKVTELQTDRLGIDGELRRLRILLNEKKANIKRLDGKISILQAVDEPNMSEIELTQQNRQTFLNESKEIEKEITEYEGQLAQIEEELQVLYDSVDTEKVLPKHLYQELISGGIKEGTYTNNAVSNEADLFFLGTQELETKRLAKINLEIDVIDFLNINDYFFNENTDVEDLIRVEDKIRVTYEKFNMFYEAKINSINRTVNGIKLFLSNVTNLQTNISLFSNILGRANRIGEIAKTMEDKMKEFDNNMKLLEERIKAEIDMNKTEAITSFGNNIRLGVDGLTSFDIDNPQHIMRLNNSRLQISKDGFQTFETIADTDGIKGGVGGDVSIMDVKFPTIDENKSFGKPEYISNTSISSGTTILNSNRPNSIDGNFSINFGKVNEEVPFNRFGILNSVSEGGTKSSLSIGGNNGRTSSIMLNSGENMYGEDTTDIIIDSKSGNSVIQGSEIFIGEDQFNANNYIKVNSDDVYIYGLRAEFRELNGDNIEVTNLTADTIRTDVVYSDRLNLSENLTANNITSLTGIGGLSLEITNNSNLKGNVIIDKNLTVKGRTTLNDSIDLKGNILMDIRTSLHALGTTIDNDISTFKELNVLYSNFKTTNNMVSNFPLTSGISSYGSSLKSFLTMYGRAFQQLVYELNEQGIVVGQ